MLKYLVLAVLVGVSMADVAPAADVPAEVPPAPGPDYVTALGLRVYDPFHHSFPEQVDVWALMTMLKAPPEDFPALLEIFDGQTVIIHEGDRIVDDVFPCGKAPEGKMLLGCTDPFSKTINIAWRGCDRPHMSSAGIFAHEQGHLADFFQRGVLGHTNEQWFGPDQDRMASAVGEPLCRMGGA